MKIEVCTAAALALTVGTTAQAQQTVYWSTPQTAAQQSGMTYFPMGTPIALTTRTQLSTKSAKPGDRVYLEVAESLSYRGQTVLPAGTVAVGEVAQADRNGHFGRKGKLALHLLYVETPSGPVRLNGRAYDEGTSGTAVSVATIAFVSVLGFLVHGTSATLPAGTTVNASLAEPLRFAEHPAEQVASGREAAPDVAARPLPARFDPRVFGGAGYQPATSH